MMRRQVGLAGFFAYRNKQCKENRKALLALLNSWLLSFDKLRANGGHDEFYSLFFVRCLPVEPYTFIL
jgi:hypothetical protein